MLETVQHGEVSRLAKSDRAGLRVLACEVVGHLLLMEHIDEIVPLLHDNHAEVRAAAVQTLGILRPATYHGEKIEDFAIGLLQDHDTNVAISAAWLLTLYDPIRGQQAFEFFLGHDIRDTRILAAAALVATGKYGAAITLRLLTRNKILYIRLNLALGLINQRLYTDNACQALATCLIDENERWMWDQQGIFRMVVPSNIRNSESASQSPESISQLVRLDILNTLAIMQAPNTQETIRRFLQQKNWGVSGLAAALLLTEGDESAIELVKGLLNDPDSKVRVQAALVLALWGRDEEAIAVLQQAYPKANREMKERILEGIGRVGALSSIPFLVETLKEPYQTLRVIAAMALIQCLNH